MNSQTPGGNSELLARLQAFLPQIKKANEELDPSTCGFVDKALVCKDEESESDSESENENISILNVTKRKGCGVESEINSLSDKKDSESRENVPCVEINLAFAPEDDALLNAIADEDQ